MANQNSQGFSHSHVEADHVGAKNELGTRSHNDSRSYNILGHRIRQKKLIWIICWAVTALTIAIIIIVVVLKGLDVIGSQSGSTPESSIQPTWTSSLPVGEITSPSSESVTSSSSDRSAGKATSTPFDTTMVTTTGPVTSAPSVAPTNRVELLLLSNDSHTWLETCRWGCPGWYCDTYDNCTDPYDCKTASHTCEGNSFVV
ncbi:Uu.00g098610.m01.CDS01 [Anthostomella pinea]|uniref:Uu.00g098610.m01.CDS01 n=1 Tax=Anthostomella pinea TaxID=933095 RepID=A0AAI8VDB2_9PEZI|nr:Uu.00g098610.m01.CDS01 [Anthostomella pinea]